MSRSDTAQHERDERSGRNATGHDTKRWSTIFFGWLMDKSSASEYYWASTSGKVGATCHPLAASCTSGVYRLLIIDMSDDESHKNIQGTLAQPGLTLWHVAAILDICMIILCIFIVNESHLPRTRFYLIPHAISYIVFNPTCYELHHI